MLTDLAIENFQSIQSLHLRLGQLTVITGPTGSGKSAVVRALRHAAFNTRGNSFIRHGTKKCTVGFGPQGEGWFIALERGQSTRGDQYRVARLVNHPTQPDGYLDEPEVDTYTKLGGEAPEDVLRLHGLTKLNFSAQFSRPFLLDDSGAQVARMLGELTNVVLVFEAAREAARRKSVIAADLKRSEALTKQLAEQVQQYAALPAQRAAQDRAEQHLQRAQEHDVRRGRLTQLLLKARSSEMAVEQAEAAVAAAEPPSLGRVTELTAKRDRLIDLLDQAEEADVVITIKVGWIGTYARQEQQSHRDIHNLLVQAGTCPTCGQPVT